MNPERKYPDGRLNPSDKGETGVAIGVEQGRVVIHFQTAVVWVGMTPGEAIDMAQVLVKNAMKAGWTGPVTLQLTEH